MTELGAAVSTLCIFLTYKFGQGGLRSDLSIRDADDAPRYLADCHVLHRQTLRRVAYHRVIRAQDGLREELAEDEFCGRAAVDGKCAAPGDKTLAETGWEACYFAT